MSYPIMKLKADHQQNFNKLLLKEGQRKVLLEQRAEAMTNRDAATQKLGAFDLVQVLLEKTTEYARKQAKARIEEIVTHALAVVFGKDYRFTIEIEKKGHQPVAEYFLTSEGITTQLEPPDYDRGGGVADVVSLALRLAVGELTGIKGPLFLDEVGKHVSAEYAPNVAYFLKEYSQMFERQIVLITHNTALADVGDLSLSVRQQNGKSEVITV